MVRRCSEKSVPASASTRSGLAELVTVTVTLSISQPLQLLHVLHDCLGHSPQLVGRAELELLSSGVGAWQVAGRDVERDTGIVDLLVVGESEDDPALEHVAPVWSGAAIIRKPAEQRGRVETTRP